MNDFIPYLNPKDGSLLYYKCAGCDEIVLEENQAAHKCKNAFDDLAKLAESQHAQTENALAGLAKYMKLKEKETNPLGLNKGLIAQQLFGKLSRAGWRGANFGWPSKPV